MLNHPTYDKLIALGLTGMARALGEQRGQADANALTFEERLALLIDREAAERHNKRLANRLKFAGLRQNAVVEDIDLHAARGLDRALLQTLIGGDWIDRNLNLIIVGPTGIGKSFFACALGHKACRDDRSVLYQRIPRLFSALAVARGDGRDVRLLHTLARVDLLILDDWGLAPLTLDQSHDLLEIVDDRHNRSSTIITSQTAGRALARDDRKPNGGRCHSRSPCPHCSSPAVGWTINAQAQGCRLSEQPSAGR
jgi:DNA replication protein DnaC